MKIKEVNIQTGEVNIINIDETDEQKESFLIFQAEELIKEQELIEQAAAKAAAQAKLAALGLTVEDLQALGL